MFAALRPIRRKARKVLWGKQSATPSVVLLLLLSCSPTSSAPQNQREPLSTFKDCEHCPEMVVLPRGSYLMGSSDADIKLLGYPDDWTRPQHEVEIDYTFAIGRYEVTVDELAAYVADTGAKVGGDCAVRMVEHGEWGMKYKGTLHPASDQARDSPFIAIITDGSYAQPGLPVSGNQPASCISRNEIKQYLAWVSKKTGKHYRLPSEAEWEYAYRAGTATFAFFGNDLSKTCSYANFADGNSGFQVGMMAPCSEKQKPVWTAAVGSYKPNPWGLYDMAGNVQEMVEDCVHESYDGAPADGSPWSKAGCREFVTRGGDFEHTARSMGAIERLLVGYVQGEGSLSPVWTEAKATDVRTNFIGFRVAVSLDGRSGDRK
jgi:formylglycine-generating enzyme required for sulfatase activity